MNQKNAITTSVVVIVVIVAGILIAEYFHHKNATTSMEQSGTSTQMTQPTATPSPTPSTSAKSALAYEAALKAYPERFQFDQCKGTPAVIAVRKNTPVMLDNRSNADIIIKADTDTFNIVGYSYAVFYPQVIENLAVTCDGKNSVTLNVEQ